MHAALARCLVQDPHNKASHTLDHQVANAEYYSFKRSCEACSVQTCTLWCGCIHIHTIHTRTDSTHAHIRAHINGHHHLTYKRARKHTNLLARHATTHAVLILCIAGTPLISASTWSLSHLHTSHAYAHYSRVLVTRLSSIFVVPSHTLHTTTVLVRLSSLSPSGHCVGPFVLHHVSLFIRV